MTKRNSLVLAMVLASSAAMAAWTDTGVTPAPRGTAAGTAPATRPATPTVQRPTTPTAQPYNGPTSQRPSVPASQRYNNPTVQPYNGPTVQPYNGPTAQRPDTFIPPDLYSAFLDAREPSDFWCRAFYAAKGDVEDSGEGFGLLGVEANWDLAEFRNVGYGDIFLSLHPALTILTDDAGISAMPDALLAAPVDVAWIWRYLNGWSLEIGAAPGIYADIKGLFQASAISLPFRGILYYNFSEETAVRFGGIVRPNWDTVFMPVVGIAWKPSEMFRIEAGIPETLAELRLARLTLYGRVDWLNVTYALDDGGSKPERITFNDWRVGVGTAIDFTDTFRLAFELGLLAGRDISFEGGASDVELDVDSVPYFSVLLGSEF